MINDSLAARLLLFARRIECSSCHRARQKLKIQTLPQLELRKTTAQRFIEQRQQTSARASLHELRTRKGKQTNSTRAGGWRRTKWTA